MEPGTKKLILDGKLPDGGKALFVKGKTEVTLKEVQDWFRVSIYQASSKPKPKHIWLKEDFFRWRNDGLVQERSKLEPAYNETKWSEKGQ